MEARQFLKNYSQQSVPFYRRFFQKLKKKASEFSPINQEMVEVLQKFAQTGKHIRGALTVLGYQCARNKKNEDILPVAMAVDLLHSALLIADDIMDKDCLRRGSPTIHKFYEDRPAQKYQCSDAEHFGISMAFNLSLLAVFFAEEIFSQANFDAKKLQKAGEFMNKYLADTVFGQGIDVARQGNLAATIKEVFAIHRLKTAYYTISGPLQIGGILAGIAKEKLQAMAQYGEKIGIAFQLRDDELGIFGNERILGKPVDSDLKQGKNTVLFVKAFEQANAKQRKILEASFGNLQASQSQLEKVREIIIETGALKFSQEMSQRLVNEGKSYISKITPDKNLQRTLYNIADFMVKREI